MADIVYDYLKRNNLLTGDPGKDRRLYVELNTLGDESGDEVLDGEDEAELEELGLDMPGSVKPLDEN